MAAGMNASVISCRLAGGQALAASRVPGFYFQDAPCVITELASRSDVAIERYGG